MKTPCLILALSLSMVSAGLAQNEFGVIEIGVKAGPNLASISHRDIPATMLDPSVLLSFYAGVFGNFYLDNRWSLSSEILYSGKGFNAGGSEQFHYLSMPLLLYYTPLNNLRIGVGIESGFLLAATSKAGNNASNASSFYDYNTDCGFIGGLEYVLSKKAQVGARYVHGFENVIGDSPLRDQTGRPTEGTLQNRVLRFYLGYQVFRFETK